MKYFTKSMFYAIFAKSEAYIKNKKQFTLFVACVSFLSVLVTSCADEEIRNARHTPMRFDIAYPGTRVADNDFEDGDTVGLFVAKTDMPLEIGGNLVNNEALTYDKASWKTERTLYWDEGTFNAYAYYPYQRSVTSIEDFPVSVRTDQFTEGTAGKMDGYEASDMLYAMATGLQATSDPVKMTFKHIMSKVKLRLIKGEDYEGELPDKADVYVHNTYTSATVDLSAGVATANGRGKRETIKAKDNGNHIYSAIVVPQRISNRTQLIEVVMNGVSYLYESSFLFKPGTEHLINLIITANPEQVKIEIGGEIQNWQ